MENSTMKPEQVTSHQTDNICVPASDMSQISHMSLSDHWRLLLLKIAEFQPRTRYLTKVKEPVQTHEPKKITSWLTFSSIIAIFAKSQFRIYFWRTPSQRSLIPRCAALVDRCCTDVSCELRAAIREATLARGHNTGRKANLNWLTAQIITDKPHAILSSCAHLSLAQISRKKETTTKCSSWLNTPIAIMNAGLETKPC